LDSSSFIVLTDTNKLVSSADIIHECDNNRSLNVLVYWMYIMQCAVATGDD